MVELYLGNGDRWSRYPVTEPLVWSRYAVTGSAVQADLRNAADRLVATNLCQGCIDKAFAQWTEPAVSVLPGRRQCFRVGCTFESVPAMTLSWMIPIPSNFFFLPLFVSSFVSSFPCSFLFIYLLFLLFRVVSSVLIFCFFTSRRLFPVSSHVFFVLSSLFFCRLPSFFCHLPFCVLFRSQLFP
jgi:hypothetical protein